LVRSRTKIVTIAIRITASGRPITTTTAPRMIFRIFRDLSERATA